MSEQPAPKPVDPAAATRRLGITVTIAGTIVTLIGLMGLFSGGSLGGMTWLLAGMALTIPGVLAQILAQLVNAEARR